MFVGAAAARSTGPGATPPAHSVFPVPIAPGPRRVHIPVRVRHVLARRQCLRFCMCVLLAYVFVESGVVNSSRGVVCGGVVGVSIQSSIICIEFWTHAAEKQRHTTRTKEQVGALTNHYVAGGRQK